MFITILFLSQFTLADSLYFNNYYDLAQIEYTREFFFYPGLKLNQEKRLRFALSLMKNDPSKGLEEFNNIINEFTDLKPEIKTEMARCYVNFGNYYQASELFSQAGENKLLGFTYLLDNRFTRARNLFITTGDNEIAKEINGYINMPKKSRKTAFLLSLICPGAGQIYAGNTKQGIQDFLLNLGSGYLFYNALKKKNYIDAILVFNFLFQRFYLGSIYNAQKSADNANIRTGQIWLKKMKGKYFKDTNIDY